MLNIDTKKTGARRHPDRIILFEQYFAPADQRWSLSINSSTMIERTAKRTVKKRRCPQQL